MLSRHHILTYAILTLAMLACKDEEVITTNPAATPSVIQFNQSQVTLNENENGSIITLSLSKAATQAGKLYIALSSEQLLKFNTEPRAVDGKIELPIVVGSTTLSFTVKPIDDAVMDGNKSLSLSLLQPTSGFQLGTQKTVTVSVIDDERPVEANFLLNTGTVRENSDEGATVMVALSGNAPAASLVIVNLSSQTLVYGIDFTTEPTLINGKIVLSVAVGTNQASFKIKPINNAQWNGDRTLQLAMESVEGGIKKGTGITHNLTITDDELAVHGKSYQISAGGWSVSRRYEYLENGAIAKITWSQYTPAYKGGTYTYEYIQGRLHKMIENERRETYYLWEGDRIVRSEQFTNGLMTELIHYGYDDARNVGEAAIHYRQPDGSMKLGILLVYLYTTQGDLYKKMNYAPIEGTEDYNLLSTYTYDNYFDKENPFPLEILPNVNSQPRLPRTYRVEEGGKDILYTFTYEFDTEGRPTKRVATSNYGSETATYSYF